MVHYRRMIIGESARRLGDDLPSLLPGRPRHRIKQYGNVARHAYDDLDPNVA